MNEEAKLILSAYRSHRDDSTDPEFADALSAAQNDPALAQWLASQQEFDREVSKKLAEVPVPSGLRERILAGAKVSRPRPWWRLPQLWLAAAAVALIAGFGFFVQSPPHAQRGIAEWQQHALSVLDDLEHGRTGFEKTGEDPVQLVGWLHGESAPAPADIPRKLAARKTYGCKMWQWNGQRISLMCFNAGEKGGVHLFTTDRGAVAKAPPEGQPIFARQGQWFVASWSKDQQTYMLAGEEGEPMLRELLARTGAMKQIAVLVPLR